MRLAVIGPVHPYRGGIAHFTTRLGQVLMENGHAVQMISFSRQYPAFLYPGKTDKDPSQEHPSIAAQYLLDPLYPWTWLRAARAVQEWQPELTLVQWWTSFWGPASWGLASLLRTKHIPVVFNIHNVMPHEQRFFDRWIAKSVLSRAAACIPLSPREEQRLRALLPKMRVFPAKLPAYQVVSTSLTKTEARQRLGLPLDVPVLLHFGIIRPYKGLNVLLDALGLLKQEGLAPLLLVAGEFWQGEQLYRDQINQLRLQAQVRLDNRFIPNEELGAFFSAADFFVAPYLGGTQSGAIKTALEFGLPVLASDRIASDLPLERTQIKVHAAGDAAALGRDIRQAIQQGEVFHPSSEKPISDGWAEFIQILQLVRDTLCQAQ